MELRRVFGHLLFLKPLTDVEDVNEGTFRRRMRSRDEQEMATGCLGELAGQVGWVNRVNEEGKAGNWADGRKGMCFGLVEEIDCAPQHKWAEVAIQSLGGWQMQT